MKKVCSSSAHREVRYVRKIFDGESYVGALHVDNLKLRENKIKVDLAETSVPELYLESFGSQ
jgi:hypothetical protein